jgi:hypothetical protein
MLRKVKNREFVPERDLAALAKKWRQASGKSKAAAAREMGVKEPAILYAEEHPAKSFTKLRCRMIEAYSRSKISGPFYKFEKNRMAEGDPEK